MKVVQKIGFYTAFILPALVITGVLLGGMWNYLAIGFVFIIITVVDQWVGLDTTNVSDAEAKIIGEEFFYRLITYVWAIVQVAFLIWGVWVVSENKIVSLTDWIGFTISFALVTGGIGITVAHELGHKKSAFERFCSKLILMTVCYMHFYIEHNRGHHVTVATPEDPATARKNEHFYRFWFRSVFSGYGHAWKISNQRLRNQGTSPISVQNDMIWFALLPVLFCGVLTRFFSPDDQINWNIPLFFLAQSIIAFSLLELVNYIEHYGIVRRRLASGQFERVNPLHSWNASHLISNFFLFQLQRHSDHHANAIKRYQILNHVDESPQLPFGYPTMILLALVPPLWFHRMNPLLEEWQEKVYQPAVPL